jgi:hypothetical protein
MLIDNLNAISMGGKGIWRDKLFVKWQAVARGLV